MARRRGITLRRLRRRLRGRNGRLAVSAVAAGLVLAAIAGHARSGSTPSGTQISVTASSNVALGQQLAAAYGWGAGAQWTCLDELWIRESGWQMVWNAQGSGAYGIPQALPASKMAAAGGDYMTDPATQIR